MSGEHIYTMSETVDAVELLQEALKSGSWNMDFNEKAEIVSVYWSPVFRRMVGYKDTTDFPDTLDSFINILYEEDRDRVVNHYWNSVKDYTNRCAYDIEYRIYTKNRGIRWFHAAGRVARRDDGSPIYIVGFFIDIDDQKKSEERIAAANKERDDQLAVLNSVAKMYYSMHLIDLKNDTYREYATNKNLVPFLNDTTRAREQMQITMENVVVPQYLNSVLAFTDLNTLPERMKDKQSLSAEFVGVHAGWFLATFSTIDSDSEGYPLRVMFTVQIIDDRKKREEYLYLRSMTDDLTALYNRRAYDEELEKYRIQPIEDDLAFITMDLNRLKYVNDTFGHAAGDELIQSVSRILRNTQYDLRKIFKSKIFRIGGDEFTCLCHMKKEDFPILRETFGKYISEWVNELTQEKMSVSFGVAFRCDCMNMNIDELARYSDSLMYKAKTEFYQHMSSGRNVFSRFSGM